MLDKNELEGMVVMDFSIFIYVALLVCGLLILWWSGDKSVRYSRQASYLFGLSTFFIGFVIVSISTGIPELSVALTSVFNKVPNLSVGDIIGSNFTDISLVLGIPTVLFGAIYVRAKERKDLIFSLVLIFLVMGVVFLFGTLKPIHGLLLIGIYIFCLVEFWKSRHIEVAREEEKKHIEEKLKKEKFLVSKIGTVIKLLVSIALVLVSSQLCVFSAVKIAAFFKISIVSIGSTIIALGTSFPELALSISAVRRKDYSLALGNALGSVLEQGTLILGILAFSSKNSINVRSAISVAPFMFVAFGIVGYGIIKRNRINRLEGIALLLTYVAFIAYQIFHFKLV